LPRPRDRSAGASARFSRLRALTATPRRQALAALLVYGAFTIFLTWPLVTHLDSTIYLSPARPKGDYTSVIANTRELVEGWHNPFLPGRIHDFNAPYGAPITWVNNVATFASTTVLYALTAVVGATAAVGLFVMIGFVASAMAMFLFVRRYTGSPGIALIIGYAYGFYPYVVANGEHPHHIHGWVFVLMAWRMVELYQRPTIRNGLLAGAACVVALAWAPYFILLGGVLFATLLVAALILAAWRGRLRSQLVPQLAGVGIVLAFLGFARGLTAIDVQAAAVGHATLVDLFAQSARPLNYLIPSGHNPVVGDATRPFLQARGWFDATEKSLYVGISIALLALVGVLAAVSRRLPRRTIPLALMFSAVALVALAFSAPPKVTVAGHIVSFPSYYVWKVESGWRIYERFVIVVMLGLCVVAAFGLQALIRGRGPRFTTAVLLLTAVVVPLDLWSKYEPNTARLEEPAIYRTLRAQPAGIVAEYPIQPSAYAEDYDELYNQQFHGKPIVNGFPARTTDELRTLELARLSDPNTAGVLAARGVRYVLLKHRSYIHFIPKPGQPRNGYKLIQRSSFADLYRVTAPPSAPTVAQFEPVTGFGGAEGVAGSGFRWTLASPAVLAVSANCSRSPCAGQFYFRSESFEGRRRRVTVRQGGRVLARRTVSSIRDISFPIRFHRRTKLVFSFTPGPTPIAKVVRGSPDRRSLGITVEEPRFAERHRR
jgi:hypothetical protein